MFTSLGKSRGSLRATFVVLGFSMVVFLSALYGHFILSEIQATGQFSGYAAASTILDSAIGNMTMLGPAIIFMVFGFLSIIAMRAFRTSLHPVFIVPGIIIIGLMGASLSWISNMLYTVINSAELQSSANAFPAMVPVVKNLPKIGMVLGGLILLLMIGRSRA